MTNSRFVFRLAVLGALWATAAGAQTPSTPAQPAGSEPAVPTVRFATTTVNGDTGLWFVPTAEVLARGKWSASAYRVGLNYREGFTNVSDVPVTFGYGITGRAELFGSLNVVTRIDRDLRPLFTNDPKVGGVVGRYPLVNQGWSGNKFGDLTVGVKFNLKSEADQKSPALAVRGMIKLPTASKDEGAGSGGTDGLFDFIVSKEAKHRLEASGYAGLGLRSSPDEASQASSFRYGFGAGFQMA